MRAKEILENAYPHGYANKTDRRCGMGKINKTTAWEIVRQPTREPKPYALYFATYDPNTDTCTGRCLGNFEEYIDACNLVTNAKNNGVRWNSTYKKYMVYVVENDNLKSLGQFNKKADAVACYEEYTRTKDLLKDSSSDLF